MFKIALFVVFYYILAIAGGILFASMGGLAWGTAEFQQFVLNVLGGATSILMMIGVFWFIFL